MERKDSQTSLQFGEFFRNGRRHLLFISVDDFFRRAKQVIPLTRAEMLECAGRMRSGDESAREKLLEGCLPQVARAVGGVPSRFQTLELILRCCISVERAAERFDFRQGGEPFSHRVNWCLRQTMTRYIAEKGRV